MATLKFSSTIKSIASTIDYVAAEKIICKIDTKNLEIIDELYRKHRYEIYNYLENHKLEKTAVDRKIDSIRKTRDNLSLKALEKLETVSDTYNKCRLLNHYFNR